MQLNGINKPKINMGVKYVSEKNMVIRIYKNDDLKTVAKLFYETVHSVNSSDYSAEQLSAWAKSYSSLQARKDYLIRQNTMIAEIGGNVVGFGSIDSSGYLDLLFTHKDYQRQGIATALCNELEKEFAVIKTYASVTAKPFFEKRGYTVVKEQEAERFGVKLKNFEMQKKNSYYG